MYPFENGAKTLGTPAGQSRAPAKMRGGVRRGPTIKTACRSEEPLNGYFVKRTVRFSLDLY